MTRSFSFVLASAVLFVAPACTAVAQQPAMQPPKADTKPVTQVGEALAAYNQTKTIIIGSVESMPAENFSFKPTPEIRSYAELFTHVAQAQKGICSAIAGTTAERSPQSTASTKEEVLALIKKSFDDCDAAYNSVTDANASEVGGQGYMRGTKLGNMWKNVAHNNEMYGQMVVYLRLKGIVPPSTAMRGRM
jgi:uncharacterized damage-inducible protein DinB